MYEVANIIETTSGLACTKLISDDIAKLSDKVSVF